MSDARLLAGLTVFELPSGVAGAVCGMLLADGGARVIKLEGGSRWERSDVGRRVWDRGKESALLGPGGIPAERLPALVGYADVIVHGHLPSRAREPGLDLESASAVAPSTIMCSITAYGTRGPLAERAGNDALINARTGFVSEQPGWSPGPTYVMSPLASVAAGLLAVQGITAALIARASTGRGQLVETSLLAGAVALTAHSNGAKLRPRELRWVVGPIGLTPFTAGYQCGDGRWLTIACLHSGFVRKAVEALDIARAANEILKDVGFEMPALLRSPDACLPLFELLSDIIRTRSQAEWIARLEAADVPVAATNTPEEAVTMLRELGFMIDVNDPEVGAVTEIRPPLWFGRPDHPLNGARRVGQDTASVLREVDIAPQQPRSRSSPPPSAAVANGSAQPLGGVRVVEIANVIAGPLTARFLADLGADVIKIEAPDGGDIARRNESPEFLALNAGKRSIALDLKSTEGREIGRRIALSADVVVNSMRPGVAERLGLGREELLQAKPALIYCQVSGYGSSGPLAGKPGFDILAGSLAGLAMTQGGTTGKPARLRVAAVDHTASLLAAAGVLVRLFARARRGEGGVIETSLLDAAMLIGSGRLVRHKAMPPEVRFSQYGPHAQDRLYRTVDGWIQLAVPDDKFEVLCEVMGLPALALDERFADPGSRHANDAALVEILAQALVGRTATELSELLATRSIPCATVAYDYESGLFSDPQASALGLIADLVDPVAGSVRIAHRWIRLSSSDIGCQRTAPRLGQHGPEILRECAYSGDEIAGLVERAVVRLEDPPVPARISASVVAATGR